MQDHEYDTLRAVEDHHWWYAVLHDLVRQALKGKLPPRSYLLDAGCGTGGMLGSLQEQLQFADLAGVDVSPLALECCRQRGLEMVRAASVNALPYADGEFDAVLSLDVLYHEGVDENAALAEMVRVLRPGGLLVLNLPAFECLRGSHDVAVCGVMRYRSCHVRSLAEHHSLTLEMIHYWNAWLFLPLLCWRQWSRSASAGKTAVASDLKLPPAWLNRVLAWIGKVDARLARALRLPFGSSLFAVARKTTNRGMVA